MSLRGQVWKYGNNVDTDVIMPGRYCHITDAKELAKHVLEDLDAAFAGEVRSGDVVVGGNNFGCGSSREVAPMGLKTAGVSCVVANSFARIFFRNCINIGLPIVESPEFASKCAKGDEVEIDLEKGELRNLTNGAKAAIPPYPPEIRAIIDAGGLMNYIKRKIAKV
ncbi:MAG: 3-isopropylmalate dehydratase small subunit [Planctomycetes bacterium]|nr:3-isopropylmalate dehydratase small subunit [Planctomycetota bacterium]